jgi:hypothetical protein
MTDILDTFRADLARQNDKFRAKREAEKTDKRLNGLLDYVAIFAPTMPRHGMAGAGDVFGGLMSARHWRNLRAKDLCTARKLQLHGDRASAIFWLRKAAEHRKDEKRFRAAERRAEIMPIICDAIGVRYAPALTTQAAE